MNLLSTGQQNVELGAGWEWRTSSAAQCRQLLPINISAELHISEYQHHMNGKWKCYLSVGVSKEESPQRLIGRNERWNAGPSAVQTINLNVCSAIVFTYNIISQR